MRVMVMVKATKNSRQESWYAKEAARFYASIFPDSRVDRVTPLQSDSPSGPPGSVKVVSLAKNTRERELLEARATVPSANGSCAPGGATRPGENVSAVRSEPLEGGYAPVNGIQMYYEVHGRRHGVPLVLLHGGGSTIEVTFSKVLPVFARGRRVIAVEEQGHGRTTDRDQPLTFESSADDVAALLRQLEVGEADVLGFSNGASVALQVAIRHPQLVRKLIFASSITKREGARPQLWEFMKQADFSNMPQPLKDAFLRVNPDLQKLKTMHDKDAARMRTFEDVPEDAVRSVRAPTLIVLGDQDVVKPEHAVEMTRLISGARLLVLPGGHGDYLGEAVMTRKASRYPELTARLIEEFLDEQ